MICDKDTVLKKLLHYCSYQDRSLYEVCVKLKSFDLPSNEYDDILKILIDEGFVDDKRYSESFVRAKLRYRKWGVNKIRAELRNKGIDASIIDKALLDVDPDIYYNTLLSLLQSKKTENPDLFKEKNRLMRFALQRGYQFEMIQCALDDIFNK